MGRSIDGLPPEMRLNHYRLLAENALERARTAINDETRLDLLGMANNWHILAEHTERLIKDIPYDPNNK